MARDGIDIKLLGDRELERKLARFERKLQRRIIVRAFKRHLEVVRQRIINHLSGDPVEPRTGRLRSAMATARKRSATRRPRRIVRWGLAWPTRAELGIAPDDPHFYPAAIEYGTEKVPAKPFMRPAIDRYRKLDVARLARAMKREIRRLGGE